MGGFGWRAAAALLVGTLATYQGASGPGAAGRAVTGPIVGKVGLPDEKPQSLLVGGLPQDGAAMLRGEWARR